MKTASALESTLGRVSLRIASKLDLDDVLREITRGLVHDLDGAMARIWLTRPDDPGHLQLVASAGLSEQLDGSRSRVAIGELKIGEVAATRSAVCTSALEEDPRFVDKAWLREHALTSFGAYPLEFDGTLLGVLAMFSRRALSAADFEQLGVFAAQASVAIKNAHLFAEVTALTRRLEAENAYLKEELHEARPAGIVGESAAMGHVLRELERVAPTTSTVLLLGETGTGKELFARALHEMSRRRNGPLVKLNCAAISPTLIESELFGHEKGAFTGALARRIGRFELADGGTLFLDEVGELPLDAQAKLLRVLQEQEFERVGGTHSLRVDVRIVVATNRDLAAEVRAHRFRADLFFRLNVFPVAIPPLRARKDDIPLLANAYLRVLAERLGADPKGLDDRALAVLVRYDWPGNVRELQNVLERAAILARGRRIHATDLTLPEAPAVPSVNREADSDDPGTSLKQRVEAFERRIVADALSRANGNQSEAARLLRTSRATLQYKMKAHGLGS